MDQARSYDFGGNVRNVECSSTKSLHHELYFPKNSKRNRESSTIHALGISTKSRQYTGLMKHHAQNVETKREAHDKILYESKITRTHRSWHVFFNDILFK